MSYEKFYSFETTEYLQEVHKFILEYHPYMDVNLRLIATNVLHIVSTISSLACFIQNKRTMWFYYLLEKCFGLQDLIMGEYSQHLLKGRANQGIGR